MALSGTKRRGPLDARCFSSGTLYHVVFLASAASTALVHQDEAVVASIARDAAGTYTLTLGPRFKRVCVAGAPNVRIGATDTDWTARGVPTEGSGSNTVVVRTLLAGTRADPEVNVDLFLWLVDSRAWSQNG